jgi:hypothetical protein
VISPWGASSGKRTVENDVTMTSHVVGSGSSSSPLR